VGKERDVGILTFILLMWTFGRAPNNVSKWEMGFNSVVQTNRSVLSSFAFFVISQVIPVGSVGYSGYSTL
jgi:hypothetical protein